ncbi:hypothetical protein TRFO_17738 [Tritrichomonas foetus]|uniref:Uncharacterized protein n=1 Tax=Tritrichomonas foetus TaxID=1144522 RepID=A0A1J4KMC8_9EUKA|nr:hypothetical protein TRFO_17738 [Tritrichomonas foetus]|eukprot:OHT12457.1 hypothetical protein TRFO_17738 [Tritrichomonas foetus]
MSSLTRDILQLSLDLALVDNSEISEFRIDEVIKNNDYDYHQSIEELSQLSMRARKVAFNNCGCDCQEDLTSLQFHQRYNSISQELLNISKSLYKEISKPKKYNTNLHGFNRMAAKQIFIRSTLDLNPNYNAQFIYNIGIGKHTTNTFKKPVILPEIQNTAKNMFGQNSKFEKSEKNDGYFEYQQTSNCYSSLPTSEQLREVFFREFDTNDLNDSH